MAKSSQASSSIKVKFNQAFYLHNAGELDKAKDLYIEILTINPRHFDALQLLGTIALQKKLFKKALELLDEALLIDKTYSLVFNNKGIVLKELMRFEEALTSCERAIELKPDYSEAYNNRGLVLKELMRFEEALTSHERAIELKPDNTVAYSNRGMVLTELKRFDEALASFDKAIALKVDFAEAYYNKSHVLLSLQDFENGWQLYEWRWKLKQQISHQKFSQPLWLGVESLENKTILLHTEQGLGDTIQFCRYAALVKKLGAKVLLEVPKSLIELLKYLEGVEVIEAGKKLPVFDYHCPLLSLPLAFKTQIETIPFPKPYLKANQNKINQWQKRIGNINGIKVGLVWNGGFRKNNPELWTLNERRNIPLKIFAQKVNSINVNYFSLQKGNPAESEIRGHETEYWPRGNFFNFADELIDFSETAALISHMDLIIAVDTSTAHLAAALGKPTWILNRFDSCWRWMHDREDSPWYESVKLYRQGEDRQWEPVLERVARDLIELKK